MFIVTEYAALIYTMSYPDLTVPNFMENFNGLKRVNN